MSAAAHRMTLFSRCNIRALLLLLAPVAGLTWIRKRTIVLRQRETLARELQSEPRPRAWHRRRAERRADKSYTLTWEATAPRRTDSSSQMRTSRILRWSAFDVLWRAVESICHM